MLDEAPERIEVALEQGVLVEGRVTALRGRHGVEGAHVALAFGGERRTALSDADGRFRLADVSPGRARLTLSHPDYAEVEKNVEVRETGRSDRPFEIEPVDLEEPGGVEGEVVDARGEPVTGARVSIGLAPSYLPAGSLPHGVALTDGAGRFELGGVLPGRRVVEAFSSVAGRGRASVEVVAGRVAGEVRIELSPSEGDDTFAEGGVAVTLGERGSGSGAEVVIVAVAESSEAERSGLAAGDVITAIDGTPAGSMADARRRLAGRPGTDVLVELRRSGERVVVRVAREAVRR